MKKLIQLIDSELSKASLMDIDIDNYEPEDMDELHEDAYNNGWLQALKFIKKNIETKEDK